MPFSEESNFSKFQRWRSSCRWIFIRSVVLILFAVIILLYPYTRRWILHHVYYWYDRITNPLPQKSSIPLINLDNVKVTLHTKVSKEESGLDWPQFRGMERNGISREKDILKSWPDNGPTKVLSIHGIGQGYSSPVVYGRYLLVTGTVGKRNVIFCFTTDGKKLWIQDIGPGGCEYFRGTRSTPTVDDGRVYVLSISGDLSSFDLKTGEQYWTRNILTQFRGTFIDYGLSESVLIYGNKLICTPGGLDGEVVALDKYQGNTIWVSKGSNERAGYGSPMVFRYEGKEYLLATLQQTLVCLNHDDGRQIWYYSDPFRPDGRICMMPVVHHNLIFIMGGELCTGGVIRMITKKHEIVSFEEVWRENEIKTHFGDYVGVDGYLYGSNGDGWVCRDFPTGKILYCLPEPQKSATILVEDRFISVEENGTVFLIQATPQNATIVGRFLLPNNAGETWAIPCFSRGRLYLRHHGNLYVYLLNS